jgi:preprotein translocase subunit YajC
MDLLIQSALAQADSAAQADAGLINLIMLVVLFLVFYFLLIRPQTKRVKEHKKMVDSLAKGDEVVTNGGLLGKITQLGENFIILEVDTTDGSTEIKVQRQSVAAVMPKGTLKNTM